MAAKVGETARCIFVVAAVLSSSAGLYMFVYLSVSPLPGRHVHKLCDWLVFLHIAVASLLVAIASIIFTMEIVRNLNHTVRDRTVLAKRTKSAELKASVNSLRRTRFKVVALQLTIISCCTFSGAFHIWLISSSNTQLYASYILAFQFASYMQVILLVLLTYTSMEVPSIRRILECALLRRVTRRTGFGENSSAGLAPQQLNEATPDVARSTETLVSLVVEQQHAEPASSTVLGSEAAAAHVVVHVAVESDARCTETATGPASSSQERPRQQQETQLEQQRKASPKQPISSCLHAGGHPYWDC
mmetsp:Transcript_1260/g.2593  ORF Transcript_1260/g.2593 Transcript_1260/m.2593 type:complete len:303 (+) Transcript_1260:595-1503(+)